MKLIKHTTIIMPILLVGCALLGPDYKKPQVSQPSQWNESSNHVVMSESLNNTLHTWWTEFNDKTLDLLVASAIDNNNDIQVAIGKITVAAGNLQQVNMGWVPTISAGGVYGYGQSFDTTNSISNSTLNQFSNSAAISNTGNSFSLYNVGLMPSYSLNIFQQMKKDDAAKYNLDLTKANKDAVTLTVISQVVGSYFTILTLNKQLAEQNQLISNLDSILKLVKIQYKYGLATLDNVNDYQQKLSQAKMQLSTITQNLTVTKNALAILLDKNPNEIIIDGNINQISTTNKIPLNLPSTVLNNRPDVKIAENQLKIANANIGVATSNFFPHIYLTTPVGGYNSELRSLFSASGNFWAAQVAATMPILNLGLYGLIKQSKGQYYIAYYNYVKTVREAFSDTNNSLYSYNNTDKSMQEATSLYNSAKNNAQLSLDNYKNGYISLPENLSSQINYNNATIIYTQTKLQQLQSIIGLYQSIAAGYNYKNNDKPKKFNDSHDS